MKRLFKIIIRILIFGPILFIIFCFLFDACIQFRMSDRALQAYFQARHVPLKIHYYQAAGRQLRYVSSGQDTSLALLFIHGAPSSCSYWKTYLTDSSLLQNCSMCAVDRPGYGYSGFGKPLTSLQQQSLSIMPVLDSLHRLKRKVIVVAASYGTSVACKLAMDFPDMINGLVLLAPSLAAGEERYFWFTFIIENPALNWFIPRMFKSANAEKVNHREELSKLLPYWPNIHQHVMYFQGAKDGLVFPSNARFAKVHLVNAAALSVELIPDRYHLITFNEKEKIIAAILQMKKDLNLNKK